ncbi:MAG: serine/threonine-protein kinase [Polyangiaceae bacterium]
MTEDADSRSQERVGSVLNEKWTLERLLGIGGMAAVYAARHRNGAKAAVKVLHADLSRHREVRERFLREGYAANRVDHPSAVKVMDDDVVVGGPDAGTAYLVMELLEGESLQDRLERGPPVGEREFLGIAEKVLDVLESAHEHGVVHRDLKPENLFLVRGEGDDPPRVKVLDFGLARLLDGATITSYGLALGTPSFMSPEQAAGRIDEIDGRTDLFSLAATGFRLRTGRRIHEGANPVELVAKMAHFAAPKVETFSPEVSPAFARVIDRALEFKREDRYANAAEMRDDVRRAIIELDGVARTEIGMSPALSVPPRSAPPSAIVPEPPPPLPAPPRLPRESTMEVSERELETSLPVLPTAPRRRSRSILPWLTLFVFVGIGLGLWVGSRYDGAGDDAGASGSASVSPSSSSSLAPPSSSSLEAGSLAPMATPTPTAPPTPTPTVPVHSNPTAKPLPKIAPLPSSHRPSKTGH